METIKLSDLKEEHIGQTFYQPYTETVGEITILKFKENRIVCKDESGGKFSYVTWAHKDTFFYLDKAVAQAIVDERMAEIENAMDTPEKLLQYAFTNSIEPFFGLSYHDIVGDEGFNSYEYKVFKRNVKKFFGVELKEVEE